ncbi:MAG: type II toxin-antitoxin system HipA family toxin [Protaetiibacter sp.]
MSSELTAYLGGVRIGRFARVGSGDPTFTFDDEWRNASRRQELSISMPKSRREHRGDAPINYLWNLLPDNRIVLDRWGSRFGVSAGNPMALLAHVGLDTAGAVQLSPDDAPTLSEPSGAQAIGVAEIAAHLRALRSDPAAWLLPDDRGGHFSLAGAQSKFTLARLPDGSWAVPTGRGASTHIVKPGPEGLQLGDLNEHVTLAAARNLGLSAAESSLTTFEDQLAIVVARYDRTVASYGTVVRLHQEDLAQAFGIHPGRKYQNDGGPGIADITRLLSARGLTADAQRFFDATLFNWAMLGPDAHAKNYSLLHEADGTRLAPLYDIATALPYPDLNTRSTKLAMSFNRRYRDSEITARDVVAEAVDSGFDPDWAQERATDIVGRITDAFSDAISSARLTGDAAAFAATIIDRSAERTQHLTRQLAKG